MTGPLTGARRILPLGLENLNDVAEPCRRCVCWQNDDSSLPVPPPVLGPDQLPQCSDALELESWVSAALLMRPTVGRVAYLGSSPVGHAVYAPGHVLPGADRFVSGRANTDAMLLAAFRVDPAARDTGVARIMLEAVARDALEQGMRALEAYGSRATGRHHGCLLPADFLVHCGFSEVAPHPMTPRLRLDIKAVTTWRAEVEAAIERLMTRAGSAVPAY